ncbi:aldo/keto reductase [Elizabethkingia meningoseptica]|uniref:aldo/keto reductase n=1 Tax=Elizabethkingia meningoseptica TaxID=238 RepID=UPI0009991879|nr:aldo/keto reductase [Elizabethkingia meningoseptica]EJK5330167.1 aldo/keto reductase [Elizabethkingia meningoseptica]MDE5467826.1 aldo/keto reductase [Elizabethkingia meningoseptica]MDE5474745.1 aldo/keto reductase [Elizabethkingia meningoseptica]MDE5478178.1 aldo/keto reductase [Elizabethkingia meningoseptica]MDE5486085.1 aldo/keto reductase [Elizabethkingia meningoseptica]
MEFRKLGNTDLEVSVITFGAWAAGGWMWGSTDRKDAVDAIVASYHEGVTSIDTAPIYGQGTSEEIVGEAIKGLSRDKVQILTKFGMRWDLESPKGDFAMHSKDNSGKDIDVYKYAGKESVIREVEDSLRRLGTDYIDLMQIHWPDTTTPISETMEALELLIQQGKIRTAGVSNYSTAQVKEARETVNVVSNQVPYSMLNRGIEKELVPYALENNLSIIAYSPMERGLLTGKYFADVKLQEGDHRGDYFKNFDLAKVQAFLQKIEPLAKEKNAGLSQLVLRWTSLQPAITVVLAGARNAEQAVQNAKAAHIDLNQEELSFINTELAKI